MFPTRGINGNTSETVRSEPLAIRRLRCRGGFLQPWPAALASAASKRAVSLCGPCMRLPLGSGLHGGMLLRRGRDTCSQSSGTDA